MSDPITELIDQAGSDPSAERANRGIGRTAATITVWNTVSRLSGFARVVATAGALGIATLGDTYQSANVVSNVLFELLAGGLLFSVLVPTFVAQLDRGERSAARALAGVLLTRALVVLGGLVAIGIALGPWIMRALTTQVPNAADRVQQVAVGSFLLWFIMPQLLLYAIGAVATALLQADRRFIAAAVAPVFNNVVVIVTMLTFAVLHDPARGVALSGSEKWLLGGGTLAGTLGLTAVPLWAARRAGLSARLKWRDPAAVGLGKLARKGVWGAGDIGLNQVMVLATVVFAGRVQGGVIAYQTAFTFFVLPHAILAHPIFTSLFPRLSSHGASGDRPAFARDLATGVNAMALLLLPAAGFLAAVALPVLTVVRSGQLGATGAGLVASVLAAYMVGLLGYSAFFLLTRASYAIDDVKSPTMIYLWTTLAALIGMAVASSWANGNSKVVALGLVHGGAVSLGSVGLFLRIRRRIGQPVAVGVTLVRASLAALVACGLGWLVVGAIGWSSRASAAAAITLAGAAVTSTYILLLIAFRTPEILSTVSQLGSRLRRAGNRA